MLLLSFIQRKETSNNNRQKEDDSKVRELEAIIANQQERIKTLQSSIEACNLRLYAAEQVLKTREE